MTTAVPRLKGRSIPDLVVEYEEGKTLREIAREVGVSHVHVARLLKAQGAKMRPRTQNASRINAAKADLAQVQAAHAVILYAYGVPIDEVALSLRRTPEWVSEQVRSSGVKVEALP